MKGLSEFEDENGMITWRFSYELAELLVEMLKDNAWLYCRTMHPDSPHDFLRKCRPDMGWKQDYEALEEILERNRVLGVLKHI